MAAEKFYLFWTNLMSIQPPTPKKKDIKRQNKAGSKINLN